MSDLAYASASELVAEIGAGRVSSLELLELFLGRVEAFNPTLNAVVVRDDERALARAREADRALARGERWGPLHGLPMTIKESYDISGLRTTRGNPALENNVAAENAVAVDRLLTAGAVIFGKTNVPYNLADFQSYNAIYGTTGNPWDPRRTPGGSSGGSAAALAAGLTPLEAGSDIGGSIRNPAHYCGVYGHKPTWGIVPLRGHSAPGVLTPADISVVGPLARSAPDLALALEVMAGPDEIEAHGMRLELPAPPGPEVSSYRVAVWADDPFCRVDREVRGAVERAADALERAGARVDREARPDFDLAEAQATFLNLLTAETSSRSPESVFEKNLARADALDPGDHGEQAALVRATVQRHRTWRAFNERRTGLRWAWRRFFDRFDVLLCPAACVPAFPHDQSRDLGARTLVIDGERRGYWEQLFWAGMVGVAYLPATVAPAGRSAGGLPIGVQIVGPEYGDRVTIALADRLADAIGGFSRPAGYD